MKKRVLAFVLAVVMVLSLTACGKGISVDGKYTCYSVNGAAPSGDQWIQLEKSGKGTMHDEFDFSMEWSMIGDMFTAKVSFLGETSQMNGKLKDGVLEVDYNGDAMVFAKEGVTMQPLPTAAPATVATEAPTDPAVSSLVGRYPIYAMTGEGMELNWADLYWMEMTEGVYVEFREDGTGSMCFGEDDVDEFVYDEAAGTMTADGETVSFWKDGDVIVIFFAEEEMSISFAPETVYRPDINESMFAPGNEITEPAVSAIVGRYPIYAMSVEGTEYNWADLYWMDMTDNIYIEFREDGTGMLYTGDDDAEEFTYDEAAGTLISDVETLSFWKEGEVIVVYSAEEELRISFAPESVYRPDVNTSQFAPISDPTVPDDDIVGIPIPSYWYGSLKQENASGAGIENRFVDIWAAVDHEESTGLAFFEAYEDWEMEGEPLLSMYIDLTTLPGTMYGIIGDKDAWIYDTYLTKEDESNMVGVLMDDGSLRMIVPYVSYDGARSATLTFCLRQYGELWNENDTMLPPSYSRYLQELE